MPDQRRKSDGMREADMSTPEPGRWEADRFEQGVDHFNAGRYWEAHESWEQIWLECRSGTRDFLQGLIQLSAAWYHIRRGNFRGADRLLSSAASRLDRYPPLTCGLDRTAAEECSAEAHRAFAAGPGDGIETVMPDPRLHLVLVAGWREMFAADR
jgi:uncharacterized protein